MEDYPYSILKRTGSMYEIMLLRDRHGNTFADIAKAYGISVTAVTQKYRRIKAKQIRLYIHHISVALGYDNTKQIRTVYDDAYECYRDLSCVCAYLEKKYENILVEYRAGESGMSERFIKDMPQFKPKLSKKEIDRVIKMREIKKASYKAIAKELRMTPAKAKNTYEWFYHEQVLVLIRALEEKAGNSEEKMAIWNYYFKQYKTSKKRYDALTK